MSCVNKSSKEFKDTCKRLNVSSENLEITVHEYQNTEGNENSFPSDSYIMEKLKGEPTVTKSENVIKLWEKEYSSPKSFNSYKEAIEFKAKALRFFDEKSVFLYKNNDGRYTISIAKPLQKINANYYTGNITPSENTIFVFGSNPIGINGILNKYGPNKDSGGAAAFAQRYFGVEANEKMDNRLSNNGAAYGLVTVTRPGARKSLSTLEIIENIKKLYETARQYPEKEFKVAYRNKLNEVTLNGYTGEEMIDMFIAAGPIPNNIIFSEEWIKTGKFNQAEFENAQQKLDGTIVETQKSKVERFKAQNDSLREQFRSLEKYGLNDTELSEVAEDFVVAISNAITEYQSNPKKILEDFPELSTVDRTQQNKTESLIEDLTLQFEVLSRTREGVVRLIGAEKLVDKVRKQLFSGVNMPIRLRKLGQNTGALLATAYSKFQELEDFVILGELGIDVNEASHENIEDVNNESDAESIKELYGDSQEHWQVNVRTLDVLENATFMVKRALSSCVQYDSKGKEKNSKLGIPKRVKAKDATSAILRWTRGSLSLSDMINKIEAKVKEGEKWAEPILNRLKDKSGKEADFQSQFFKVFAKHFHKASVIVKEKGKYVIKTVNENPALREAKASIKSLYNIGNHPLFKADKTVNESTFKRLKALSESLEQADTDKVEIITEILNHLGYFILDKHVEKALQSPNAFDIIKNNIKGIIEQVDKGSKRFEYNPFEYSDKNSIDGYLSKLLSPIVEQFEDTAISSYYDNGKMYQSYITPSYMTKLMLKFREEGFIDFIKEEYGKFEWFYKNGSWRNDWLNRLSRASDNDRKKLLDHKTQLHFNKNYYMRGMSEQQYVISVIAEYFNGGNESIAYYKMPLQSNKPASEFVSFYKYSRRGYEDLITSKLYDVALQELDRIKEVRDANLPKTDPNYIKNYHGERGRHFVFLDFLNSYLPEASSNNTPLGVLINKKLNGEEFSADEAVQFTDLIKSTIQENIQNTINDTISQWENQGIIDEVVSNIIKSKDLKTKEEKAKAAISLLNEFLWNDTLATTQLLQLTVTDPAYYKDTEDLQKRLAQLHSPGVRGNKDATDYKGKPITDGFLRTLVLKDVELNSSSLKSNILENVEIALDKRIEAAEESEKEALTAYKEAILEQFKEGINVADAQSYSSPTSYRKKAFIFGTWSQEKEDIYQKIKKGEATLQEIQEAMQPLKPFTYTQISKTVNGKTIKVPIQHKTAEYLLVMADAIIGETYTGKPNLLRAIFNFMEESAEKNPKEGIDTILFESSVKSGLHGVIGVADLTNNVEGEQLLKTRLEENTSNADAIPVEDYSIQQEVPLHYYEHSQVHGSQIRALLPSDLPLNSEFTFTDGKESKTVSREDFRKEYEENIATNIQESLDLLAEEFGLNEEDYNPIERRYLVSKALQREILSNSRYGVDLLKAVMIDENGNFALPLQDPIHAKRIEQLINSIVKNRINKQTIPGGPVVQVSNFGMTKRLNVRFKDYSGNLIPSRDQFNGTDAEYKKYIKEHQYSIAYFECIAPASTKELLIDFIDEKGNIDVETLEKLNPDLLKAIGYRIPTEGKHSMQPLKIVGFAPREAGEVIILPYEITLISGSDKPRHCFYQYNIKNCVNCWEALTLSRG